MPIIKCKPGNKPCGKRCVPKNYKCKYEKQQQQQIPRQKQEKNKFVTRAIAATAALAIGAGIVAAGIILDKQNQQTSQQKAKAKKEFQSGYQAKVEKIDAELAARYPEREHQQANDWLEDLPEPNADMEAEIQKIEQMQSEIIAQVKATQPDTSAKDDWKEKILLDEQANEEWYKLEKEKVLREHWLPKYALYPENETANSTGDHILETYENTVAYKTEYFDPNRNKLLADQTANDPQAAKVVEIIFGGPKGKAVNIPGSGRILATQDMQAIDAEMGFSKIDKEVGNVMVGNDILIDVNSSPTEFSSKSLAINLIMQQMIGRGHLLVPESLEVFQDRKNFFASLLGDSVGEQERPYVAAAMAQAEYFYENPDGLEVMLKTSPMDYADYMYNERKKQISNSKETYAAQFGEEI